MYPWDGKNIYFIGFMGTGKSRVGKAFAHLLGWPFADTDDMITLREKSSIKDIFANRGESYFRDVEDEIVRQVVNRKHWVIALGGGAVLRAENWQLIQQSGLTICLEAAPEVLFSRLSRKGGRPLLAGLGREELDQRINSLYDARKPVYDQAQYHFESLEEVPARVLAEKIFLYLRDEP